MGRNRQWQVPPHPALQHCPPGPPCSLYKPDHQSPFTTSPQNSPNLGLYAPKSPNGSAQPPPHLDPQLARKSRPLFPPNHAISERPSFANVSIKFPAELLHVSDKCILFVVFRIIHHKLKEHGGCYEGIHVLSNKES